MASPAYDVKNFDLSVARIDERIVDVGVPVDSIAVLGLPIGSTCTIRIGQNRPPIPLLTQGMSIEGVCPNNNEGVFLTNGLASGLLVLFVSFGSGTTIQSV